ncbi:hypothetical protein BDW22DRAFT_1426342 [Trametopsis cervina]|nr:hypothetical protein BDW22DRAFT_1426342 [Trametopsis cervina]
MDTIPEELLSDILGYCLDQPPEHLLAFSARWRNPSRKQSEHSTPSEAVPPTTQAHTDPPSSAQQWIPPSRSSPLLVSKQWLRVSSPFFYRAVKVSSSADVSTLHALFDRHPCLGHAVRTLRIESADSTALQGLLRRLPNVQTVYVALQLLELEGGEELEGAPHADGDENVVTRFVDALRELDPAQLYVWKKYGRTSAIVDAVETALGEAVIPRWTRLTHVAFSQQYEIPPAMSQSLRVLPRLRTLRMGGHGALCSLMRGSLQVVAENPALENGAVTCVGGASAFYVGEGRRMFPGRAAELLVVGPGADN